MFWSRIVDYLGWGSWGRERVEIPFEIEGRERGELLVSGGGREGLRGEVGEGHGLERDRCGKGTWMREGRSYTGGRKS